MHPTPWPSVSWVCVGVITLNGFGGVNSDLRTGDLVTYHDYIRMCERTPTTIFAGEPVWPRAKMEVPFCPEVRGDVGGSRAPQQPAPGD